MANQILFEQLIGQKPRRFGVHRKGTVLTLSTMISFFGASILLAAAPGPDIMFVLTQSLAYGKKAGLWAAFGNVCGVSFHIAAVALGLGALIANSPTAFSCVKYLGAAYLVYLAIKSLRKKEGDETPRDTGKSAVTERKFFLQGVMVSMLNPHVTVLFIAFLPQFVEARNGHVALQVVSLGLLFMLAALIVFSTVAIGSGMVRQKIDRSPSTLSNINRFASLVFVGLAVRLVFG